MEIAWGKTRRAGTGRGPAGTACAIRRTGPRPPLEGNGARAAAIPAGTRPGPRIHGSITMRSGSQPSSEETEHGARPGPRRHGARLGSLGSRTGARPHPRGAGPSQPPPPPLQLPPQLQPATLPQQPEEHGQTTATAKSTANNRLRPGDPGASSGSTGPGRAGTVPPRPPTRRAGPARPGPGVSGPVQAFRAGPAGFGLKQWVWVIPGRAGQSQAILGRAGPARAGSGRAGPARSALGGRGPGRSGLEVLEGGEELGEVGLGPAGGMGRDRIK
jgi:hypothetical protein